MESMKKPGKAESIAFVKRWRVVNEYERSELSRTSASHKLMQLAALMASAAMFPPDDTSDVEDAEVRARWKKIRKAYGG